MRLGCLHTAESVWALRELERQVNAVILTCSTLGPAARQS